MAASADETLVERALRMALRQRRPQAGLLHHTDRGCQYTSTAYQALLVDSGITVSMSRKGNCWDNAAMESFFGTLKSECVDLMFFQTRAEARQAVFEFVECFYNRVRRHSSLEYISPVAFEQLHCWFICLESPLKWVKLISRFHENQSILRGFSLVLTPGQEVEQEG